MGVKLGHSHFRRNIDRLQVFENRVLRRIFEPKRAKAKGGREN